MRLNEIAGESGHFSMHSWSRFKQENKSLAIKGKKVQLVNRGMQRVFSLEYCTERLVDVIGHWEQLTIVFREINI